MTYHVWSKRLCYLLLMVLAAGVASPFEGFVRIRVGPLYLLEIIFLAWFALAISSRLRDSGKEYAAIWPAGLFFAWGMVLLAIDLVSRHSQITDPRTSTRLLQHALLFVYPMIWMTVGIWLARTDRAVTALIILIVLFVNTMPSFFGQVVSNLSLGPLTAVVLVVCLDRALSESQRAPERLVYWFISLGLALLTFLPYWMLWYTNTPMQRTSLLVLLFMLVSTPLLRRKKFSSLKNVAITVPVFLLGFVAASSIGYLKGGASDRPPLSISDHLSDNFFGSVDKYGSYLAANPPAASMAAVRKFWWYTTIQDWRQSPVMGIGFLPEVPSLIAENMTNSWETVQAQPRFRSNAPISGPHNSYLTILARSGAIGLGLFLLMAGQWLWRIWPLVRGRELNLYEILVVMLPISGAIHALLNIGFETPRNCALMWLFAGAATVYAGAIAEAQAAAASRD